MPARSAADLIRSASLSPAQPASIRRECFSGVTIRVDCPPSTSIKKMRSDFAGLARPGPTNATVNNKQIAIRFRRDFILPENCNPYGEVIRTGTGDYLILHSGADGIFAATAKPRDCSYVADRSPAQSS